MLKKESLDKQSSEKISEGNTFQIQRIYTKDISFETPRSPMIFQQEWKPEMKLDLDTTATELEPDVNEVVLQITVTANLGSSVAFLCQVQQAGIFITNGFDDVTLSHCLGSYCPTILFPYARECISSLVQRATFPVLNIAPVNFEALLMDYINKTAQQPFQKA